MSEQQPQQSLYCDDVVGESGGIFGGTGEDRCSDEVEELPRVSGTSRVHCNEECQGTHCHV